MRLGKHATGIMIAAALAAVPAAAQVPGLPVYNQGVPRGIGLYGDVGFPNDVAGGGTAYGVTGRAGFGPSASLRSCRRTIPMDPSTADISVGSHWQSSALRRSAGAPDRHASGRRRIQQDR